MNHKKSLEALQRAINVIHWVSTTEYERDAIKEDLAFITEYLEELERLV